MDNIEKMYLLSQVFNTEIILPAEPFEMFQASTLLSDLQMIIDQKYPAIVMPRDILFNKRNHKARKFLVDYRKLDIIIYLPSGYLARSEKEAVLMIFKNSNEGYRARQYYESILYGEYKDNCLSNLRNIPFGLITANEYKLNMI